MLQGENVSEYLLDWDNQAWANGVDLDQTQLNAASDLGLHC